MPDALRALASEQRSTRVVVLAALEADAEAADLFDQAAPIGPR
jgi:hypothetical protein